MWELQFAHVVAALIRLIGQAKYDKVPYEDIILLRSRNKVVLDLPILAVLDLLDVLLRQRLELFVQSHRPRLRHFVLVYIYLIIIS